MKYRVRLDLSFDNETDAQVLIDYAKGLANKAISINEGRDNEEISFCDMKCVVTMSPSQVKDVRSWRG